MLLGLSEPDGGRVAVFGQSPRAAIAHGLVSAVLQTGGLLKDITVRETLALTGSMFADTRPTDEVMQRAGVTDIAERLVGVCSGGQQRRERARRTAGARDGGGRRAVGRAKRSRRGATAGAIVTGGALGGIRLLIGALGGIRLLIADDQALVRGALSALLGLERDIEVVAEVGRGDEVVDAARAALPDVALVDIEMPGIDGIQAAAELRTAVPTCRVIIVTTFGRPGSLKRAMQAGAAGFVVKDTPAAQLADAVRRVAQGLRVVDPALGRNRADAARIADENGWL
ncbi:response regulator receiver domain-containing protein [Microbacterium lacticum]|uniref:Response regulator receiver domain-containing protein n=3 Tax=Microbacterium lacticum TaxID=33885 RepID=A0A543KS37_9MICO|nr:response regulator receiver domain-containing protein [Microbacterium lacticum]GGN15747.1 hypothetical protein GCM10009724_06810 [Microbacterium lacticum]